LISQTLPGSLGNIAIPGFFGMLSEGGLFPIVTIAGVEFTGHNNSVIRGTNTFRRKFTRNDVMEVLVRTYILAIATAALFAIPTTAFSESVYVGPGGVRMGPSYRHHRYYNRYEGLYDRYESGRCRELRGACMHKEELD
jgi:hypothetical protein